LTPRHKATHDDDKAKLRWLYPYLGGLRLDVINRELIDKITQAKLAEGRSNATVNRHLALVRAILRKCVREWEWLEKARAVRMLPEAPRRRTHQRSGPPADRGLAGTFGGPHDLLTCNWIAIGQCSPHHLTPNRSGAAVCMDLSGRSESKKGDPGFAQQCGLGGRDETNRQTPEARLHL
jgi:hypothetical protein